MSSEKKAPDIAASTGYTGDGTAEDIVRWAVERFHPRIAIASSLEDSVLIHMAAAIHHDVRVFSIDTGRLPEETYECAEAIEARLGIRITWYFPRHQAVEKLEREKGVYSFRKSLENRRECCYIRKVEPLTRALRGMDAWMTGMRRDESVTREDLEKISEDAAHGGILKLNPLADWTSEEVRAYLRKHRLPYHRLRDRGYSSIGCACCTRAVAPGEDPRAGRWWWERPEHKECGLHIQNWSI